MRLVLRHYSMLPVRKELDHPHRIWPDVASKPNGFWLSVGDEWKQYVEENWESHSGYLRLVYRVTLKSDANIRYITTPAELGDFTAEFGVIGQAWTGDGEYCYNIDWPKVYAKYQGIIIAPYRWESRLNPYFMWYYGWDCASGCIWDTSAIKGIKLLTPAKEKVA